MSDKPVSQVGSLTRFDSLAAPFRKNFVILVEGSVCLDFQCLGFGPLPVEVINISMSGPH